VGIEPRFPVSVLTRAPIPFGDSDQADTPSGSMIVGLRDENDLVETFDW
jgi:hypothetical protein